MNTSPVSEWLFPVLEAPVEAVVPCNGSTLKIPVPHRKALVDEQTGHVLGIVGSGYQVVTNQRAIELAREVAARAFPSVQAAEWLPARACGPKTRGHVHIDLLHRAHVMNLWDNKDGTSEVFTPFLRVTNSFNTARALRFDFGYMRKHCSNGVVFEEEVASLTAPHTRRDLARLHVEVETARFEGIEDRFAQTIKRIRDIRLAEGESLAAARKLLGWPTPRPDDQQWRANELDRLDGDLAARHGSYRHDLGPNAYALFNTLTDVAARPPQSQLYRRDRSTIERTAGRWLKQVAEASARPGFQFAQCIETAQRTLRSERAVSPAHGG